MFKPYQLQYLRRTIVGDNSLAGNLISITCFPVLSPIDLEPVELLAPSPAAALQAGIDLFPHMRFSLVVAPVDHEQRP